METPITQGVLGLNWQYFKIRQIADEYRFENSPNFEINFEYLLNIYTEKLIQALTVAKDGLILM